MDRTDWVCQVCNQPNLAEDVSCINCAAPLSASPEELSLRLSTYTGPKFDVALERDANQATPLKPFSSAWWNEDLGLLGVSLAIFPVASAFGALAAIGGAIANGRALRLEEPLYGALILGLGMSIRNLVRPLGVGPKYGTRKNVVLSFVGILTLSLAVAFYKLLLNKP